MSKFTAIISLALITACGRGPDTPLYGDAKSPETPTMKLLKADLVEAKACSEPFEDTKGDTMGGVTKNASKKEIAALPEGQYSYVKGDLLVSSKYYDAKTIQFSITDLMPNSPGAPITPVCSLASEFVKSSQIYSEEIPKEFKANVAGQITPNKFRKIYLEITLTHDLALVPTVQGSAVDTFTSLKYELANNQPFVFSNGETISGFLWERTEYRFFKIDDETFSIQTSRWESNMYGYHRVITTIAQYKLEKTTPTKKVPAETL